MEKEKTNFEVNMNVVDEFDLEKIDKVIRKIEEIEKEHNYNCVLFKINIG